MAYDVSIFFGEESLSDFIVESLRQYSRLAFGGKDGLIEEIESKSTINIDDTDTYGEIVQELEDLSGDKFTSIFGKDDTAG